jgi:hypothetical protein
MFGNRRLWSLACELARSGNYHNIVMIELELKRRDLLIGSLTDSTYLRDQLTRLCHDARDELNRREKKDGAEDTRLPLT